MEFSPIRTKYMESQYNYKKKILICLLGVIKANLEACSVEGDVGYALDRAVVQYIGNQEQPSYLFNDWGLNQISGLRLGCCHNIIFIFLICS